jgi:uncharacterized membrane protein YphA (DoxX/SURF4 family)
MKKPAPNKSSKRASLLIRLGLAFSFLYAAISSFQDPHIWVGYVPDWLPRLTHLSAQLLLDSISVFQILLAGALLTGVYVKYLGLISAGLVTGIVVFNPDILVVTFRDIPIITASLALWFLDES